jgi:hypothetical protein
MSKRFLLAGLGTFTLLAGPLAGIAHAATTYYVGMPNPTSTDPDCLLPLYTTIQSAVNDASTGDTIVVCAGTYSENVSDMGKSLTFQGAQAGVDARTRSGAETTVDGATGTAFTLTGTGSTLDGFTLTGATTAQDTPAAFLEATGEEVTNTIFTGNSNAATIIADQATFSQDLVEDPNQAFDSGSGAAGFFFNSNAGSDSSVSANSFIGDFDDSAINIADPIPETGLSITDNTADTTAGGNFVVAGGTNSLTIAGNTVTGGSASGTGILLLGEDSGYSITGNIITGLGASAVSIAVYPGTGYSANGGGDISMNAFKDNVRGINVTDPGDAGTITANFNILVGNTSGGTSESPNAAIRNITNASVSAADNFYGCNGGPGATGCDVVLGNVNSTPYLVLSTTVANSTLAIGGTTQFVADLNHNNVGNLLSGHVLDNVETVTFSFTNGTVSPTTALIVDGMASTTLTATTAGKGTATAAVDNATSTQDVVVSGAGQGEPSIKIQDASTPGGTSNHTIRFPVRLSKKSASAVTVHYTTANGSAKAGTDYVSKTGVLTIPAGSLTGGITVTILGHKAKEPNKAFFVTLSDATNATIADPNASGVIRNNS